MIFTRIILLQVIRLKILIQVWIWSFCIWQLMWLQEF